MAIDSYTAALLEQFKAMNFPKFYSSSPDELRTFMQGLAAANPPGPDVDVVENHFAGDVPLRLYVPAGPVRAIIMYMHGGGWTIGNIEEADAFARTLAARLSCAIVSVEYRCAPENPFPAAVEDALTAARWTSDNHERLLGMKLPMIVCGDSAGGNLSAVVCLLARDAEGPPIAAQILLNPAVDGDIDDPELDSFDSPFLEKEEIAWFFDQYVPDRSQRSDWRFAPSCASSHAGLPPAFIITAENDLLRTQGERYAVILASAGVFAAAKRYPGTIHSFLPTNSAPVRTEEALVDIDAFISGIVAPRK